MNTLDYAELRLYTGEHWTVFLYGNQSCLGDVYLWPRREGVEDLGKLLPDETEEFVRLGSHAREMLRRLFNPDRFDWVPRPSPRFHVHLVPRYRSPREFKGRTFRDIRWRNKLSPHVPTYRTPNDAVETLLILLRKEFGEPPPAPLT